MTDLSTCIDDDEDAPEGAMDYITWMLGTAFRDKMIIELGGTSICVPKQKAVLTEGHPLVVALGRADAEELVEVVPSEKFAVPRGVLVPSSRLDAVIAADRDGLTNNQTARRLGITERHVRRLRAKSRDPICAPEMPRSAILTGG